MINFLYQDCILNDAKSCGVSSHFVGDMRAIINQLMIENVRLVQRGGKTYEQNTTKIGNTQKPIYERSEIDAAKPPVKTPDFHNEPDPLEYVTAQNDNRRHLTASQRAMVAVKSAAWLSNGQNQAPLKVC